MKKSFYAIITLLIFMLLPGCMKNEFSLRFEFPKDFVGNYIVDYYAWNSKKGAWIESVASIQEGKAGLTCPGNRPTLVYIRDASSASNSIVVYAERGDEIVVSGDNPDMNTWKVDGNKESRTLSEWRRENAKILSAKTDDFSEGRKKAISDFVKANKDNKVATLLLLTEWNRSLDPDGFLRLWNSIDEDARGRQFLEMCGSPDLIGVEFKVDADGKLSRTKSNVVKRIAVRTYGNGLDTLNFNSVKSSLLYFFEENDSRHDAVMDSIKAIVKEYSDSTGRLIADICIRPDSMVWVNTLRRDTIKGIVRGWIPHGIADRNIIDLGISRVPAFIVVKKDGSQGYSGDNLEKAIATFKKEMEKKEKKEPAKKQTSAKQDNKKPKDKK